MSFQSLGPRAGLIRAVTEKGYSQPAPSQSQATPVILPGQDKTGDAKTGTGKTAGTVKHDSAAILSSDYQADQRSRRSANRSNRVG